LRRRPPRGLLGGMPEIPSSPWIAQPMPPLVEAASAAPVAAAWRLLPGLVRHVFTHFELEIAVACGRIDDGSALPEGAWLVPPEALGATGLPSVMAKIAAHAVAGTAALLPASPPASPATSSATTSPAPPSAKGRHVPGAP